MDLNTNIETKHTIDLSDRLYKIPIAVVSVIGILGLGWLLLQFKMLPQNIPHEINVSGEGKAYAKPDIAMISFGAHTEAIKSQDAVNQNNKIMDAVVTEIKKLGVDEKDIQTTMYNLQSLYEYGVLPMAADRAGVAISYPVPSTKRMFSGYTLDQQIQVKIRNFDNINAILDKATANGANTVGQLYFTVDDMEKVRSEARQKAIAQAKEKADDIFDAAGLGGAKIVNISEGYTYPMYGGSVALEKSSDTVTPNIQAGQVEINTTVTLTYRIK